jgi:hypothetical protein
MRYVELRRHTDNDGDRLTPLGVAGAEMIGRDRLHPPYAAFVSTGAARATQMLEILRHAAGHLTGRCADHCGRALVVGHSPTTEAAVLGLAGRVVPPLGKGQGVLLIEDGGQYRVEPLDVHGGE